MFKTRVKHKGRELIITFKHILSRNEAEQFYRRLQKDVLKLEKDFQVLVDMSFLERVDKGARLFIEQAMDLLNDYGVSKVIRIVSDPQEDFGFNIMSLFHYSEGVTIHTFPSYQEAEKHLRGKDFIEIPPRDGNARRFIKNSDASPEMTPASYPQQGTEGGAGGFYDSL